MTGIEFTEAQKQQLVAKLQRYFLQQLDMELEQFDGEFLLDFISENFGCHYYNQGLYDAQQLISSKIELLGEAIVELEQPCDLLR